MEDSGECALCGQLGGSGADGKQATQAGNELVVVAVHCCASHQRQGPQYLHKMMQRGASKELIKIVRYCL